MTALRRLAPLLALGIGVAACTGGGEGADGTWPDGGILACGAPPCTFLLATASLDDRIEVFEIGAEPAYRGAVDVDLDPNPDGDYGGDRLDEPYEVAVVGSDLLVPIGHYPRRDAGSLLWLPLDLLAGTPAGGTVPADAYFDGSAGRGDAILAGAGAREAIFTAPTPAGPLIAAFENDLFAAEDTWTTPGALLLLDAAERGHVPAPRTLDDLPQGPCDAAGEAVLVDEATVAVACDGNEAVAFYALDGADLSPLALCDLPPASSTRVRYLAAAAGAVFAAESPITASPAPARVWRLDPSCSLGAVAEIAPGAAGTLTDLAVVGDVVVAAGSLGRRGLFPVTTDGAGPAACPALEGLDGLWTGADDRDLEPVALAATEDGTRLAVGLGPFLPTPDDPGYGRVVLLDLAPGDCGPVVTAIRDLSDGGPGAAPAVAPGAPATYRRMPGPLAIHRVTAADLRAPAMP